MKTFVEYVREMRLQQKRFFRAKVGTDERQEALRLSINAEEKVDRMLAKFQQDEGQAELFGEVEA